MNNDIQCTSNTQNLIALNEWAKQNNMNRFMPNQVVDKLDPEGTHLCIFTMTHSHKGGIQTDEHLRTLWFIKQTNCTRPEMIAIDVSFDLFNKYTEKFTS